MEIDIGTLQAVAISAAVLGGMFATLEGYFKRRPLGAKYSIGALFGSVLASAMTSYGLVNFGSLSAEFSHSGLVGIFLSNLMIGYGADRAINAAKKAGRKPAEKASRAVGGQNIS